MGAKIDVWQKVVLADKKFIGLLSKVWGQIPENDQRVIGENLGNINGVYYGAANDEQRKNYQITDTEAGATWFEDGICKVRIDLSRPEETIEKSIAHELAHVFYNHPKVEEEAKAKGEKTEDLKAKGENEARAKAREWGFDCP